MKRKRKGASARTKTRVTRKAMPPKKKTAATESAPAIVTDGELAPATAQATTTAPANAQATTTAPASEAKKDGKAEAKSPLAGFGKKKGKVQAKPMESGKVYVVFIADTNTPDKIFTEAKDGRSEAIFMVTPGEDDIPYVAVDKDAARVFRSWTAAKGHYIKGKVPQYIKYGEIVN
eukprot:g2681.t1